MIYFLQCGDRGPIKIGNTEGAVVWRIRQLQASAPYELTLRGVHEGDRAVEQSLHKRFSEYRFRGEWFLPVPALLRHIEAMGGLAKHHELERPDLKAAICRPSRRGWTKAQRQEFRELTDKFGREYSAWTEGMRSVTPSLSRAIETFLAASGVATPSLNHTGEAA